MIWKIDNSKLYICGSIHVLKTNQSYVFESLENIYSSSERIIFEADTTNLHLIDNTLLNYPQGRVLKNSIPRKLFRKTENVWKKLGIVGADLNKSKPWNAANIILFNLLARHGFVETHGIDKVLLNRAKTDQKTIVELEPINEPFVCFDNTPKEEQHKYLSETVSNLDATVLEFENLVNAILNDDIDFLTSYFRKYLKAFPVMFNSLIIGRNQKWLPHILDFINDNVPTLLIVGALHCVDSCGLPHYIRDKGYHVDLIK